MDAKTRITILAPFPTTTNVEISTFPKDSWWLPEQKNAQNKKHGDDQKSSKKHGNYPKNKKHGDGFCILGGQKPHQKGHYHDFFKEITMTFVLIAMTI